MFIECTIFLTRNCIVLKSHTRSSIALFLNLALSCLSLMILYIGQPRLNKEVIDLGMPSALTITWVIWNSFKYVLKLNNMDCDYMQNSFRVINLTWFCHIIFTITKTLSFKRDHNIKGPMWNLKRNSRTQELRFRYFFIYYVLCMYHLRWVQYGPVHPFVQLGQLNEVWLVHMDSILQFSVQKFLQLSNPFWDGKHAMGKKLTLLFFLILIKQY